MAKKIDPQALLAGTPYEGVSVIGQGGMGIVLEAVHRVLGQTVAVKLLRVDLGADPALMDRLHLEGKVQAKILSPHLVRVIDAGATKNGDAYIVMERLTGETLGEAIKRGGALEPASAIRFVTEALDGLALAHAAGVVHRDLKPPNLFLSDEENASHPGEPVCKVLDFGVAKFLDVGTETGGSEAIGKPIQPTAPGMLVGSPKFMSPEQAKGEPADPRSDIYSMGCTLYMALTGVVPFERRNLLEYVQAHVFERPPPMSEVLGRDLPEKLEAVVLKAMAKAPSARYETAAQFAEALRRVATKLEPSAGETADTHETPHPDEEPARTPQGTEVMRVGGARTDTHRESRHREEPAPAAVPLEDRKAHASSEAPTTPVVPLAQPKRADHGAETEVRRKTPPAAPTSSSFVLAFVIGVLVLGAAAVLALSYLKAL